MPSKPNKKSIRRKKEIAAPAEATIRGSLSDAVNEINKLIQQGVPPAEEEKLRQLRKTYFKLWEAVIQQIIDHNTALYREAITSLQEATKAATTAQEDIRQVAGAISKAVRAAKVVDKIVKVGVSFLT